MLSREVIHDTFNVMLEEGLEVDDAGNTVSLSEIDLNNIRKSIFKLKSQLEETDLTFIYNGYTYTLCKHFSKINIPSSDKETTKLDIMFRKGKNRIRLSYAIFRHSSSKLPSLSFTGNPTTLINGHNTSPLLLNDDPYQDLKLYYQIPFLFLFNVLNFKPSKELATNIKRLIIQANNVQWAMYIPCSNKIRTVNALKLIYARQAVDISDNKHIEILCNYLGFNYSYDQNYNDGFMLNKTHKGNGRVLTVNFYDKSQSNKNKGISGLTLEENSIIDKALRLDITAHRPFLIQIINAAKEIAGKLIKDNKCPKYLTRSMLDKFVASPSDKAWSSNLVMSMLLLSIRQDKNGKWKKFSFSSWLKKTILIDMMKLDLLLSFNGTINISNLTPTELIIFNEWKKGNKISRSQRNTVLSMENKLGISTKLPYKMLEAIIMLDSVQGLDEKDREKYVEILSKDENVLSQKDKNELLTLQKKSARNIRESRLLMAETFGINLCPSPVDHRQLTKDI